MNTEDRIQDIEGGDQEIRLSGSGYQDIRESGLNIDVFIGVHPVR
jgi:hypothetical protein